MAYTTREVWPFSVWSDTRARGRGIKEEGWAIRADDRSTRGRVKIVKKFFRFLHIRTWDIVVFVREQVQSGIIGVNRACVLTGISKKTYYVASDPEDNFIAKYDHLRKRVEQIIKKHSSYGIRRIKVELEQQYHMHIGRDTLGKLLKLWRLSLSRKAKKRKRSVLQDILILLSDKVNLVIRAALTKPFQAISSDMTLLIYANGTKKAYLCVHKDIVGQLVYGWSLGNNMEAALVLQSFTNAKKQIRKWIGSIPKKLLWHQDQGSQYTSYAYVDAITQIGTLSYSTKGTPTNNAGQESFFGRFKEEWADEIYEIQSEKELQKFIKKKINYYNNTRLHTSIGYISPKSFTKKYLKSLR